MGNNKPQYLQFVLHPIYLEEVQNQFENPNKAIMEAIKWLADALMTAKIETPNDVTQVFGNLESWFSQFRAHIACGYLRQNTQTYLHSLAICDYLTKFKLSNGGRYNVAKCYSELGTIVRQSGQLDTAARIAKAGLNILEGLPYRKVTANLYWNLGIALEQLADFDSAMNAYIKSSELYKLLNMIDYAKESEMRAKGMEELSVLGSEGACVDLLMEGQMLRQSGDMSKALLCYKVALQAAIRSGQTDLQAKVINNIASVFFHQGDIEQARSILEGGIDSLAGTLDPNTLSGLNAALGTTYTSLKLRENATERFEIAYKLAKEAGDEFLQANSLYGLGNVYLEQDNLIIAREKFQAALEIRRRFPEPVRLANTLNQLAFVAYKLGQLEEAEALNREALKLRFDINDIRGIAESMGNLSIISQEIGASPRISLAYIIRAARLAERIRRKIGTGDDSRVAFMNQIGGYYREVIRLACKNNIPFSAFWAFQRLQNRTFIDRISRLPMPRPANISKKLYRKEKDLLKRLRIFETDLLQTRKRGRGQVFD